MHHWLTGRKKKSVFLCFPSLSVQWPILWYCHFFFKVNQASPQISTSKGGAQVCSWFFPPCEAWGNGVVIDSCASAPVVWKSWGKPVFCRAQSLVAGLEVVLKPPHRLSHPFVRSRWSPWGIPQEAGWWMRRRKHLSPRIPQGKTLRGFKTRNTTIRDGHVHSTKVYIYPLLCRKLHSNAYGEAFLILPSTSRSLRNFHVWLLAQPLVKFSHFQVIAEGFFCTNTIL